MSEPIIYRDGSTGPDLILPFTRKGAVQPITGLTITAKISRAAVGGTLLTKTVNHLNDAGGIGSITWVAGDLVNATADTVRYTGEVLLTPPGEWDPEPFEFFVRPALA